MMVCTIIKLYEYVGKQKQSEQYFLAAAVYVEQVCRKCRIIGKFTLYKCVWSTWQIALMLMKSNDDDGGFKGC